MIFEILQLKMDSVFPRLSSLLNYMLSTCPSWWGSYSCYSSFDRWCHMVIKWKSWDSNSDTSEQSLDCYSPLFFLWLQSFLLSWVSPYFLSLHSFFSFCWSLMLMFYRKPFLLYISPKEFHLFFYFSKHLCAVYSKFCISGLDLTLKPMYPVFSMRIFLLEFSTCPSTFVPYSTNSIIIIIHMVT